PVLGAALVPDPGGEVPWLVPFPGLAEAALPAHVHADPDTDGVVRSILLAKAAGSVRLWALGMEAARLTVSTERALETADFVQVNAIRIPASDDNRLLVINFAGPEGAFRRISFASVLEGEASPSDFSGKLVILGVTAQGSGDRLFTPLSSGVGMPGIEIHANVARTILDEKFLVPAGAGAQLFAGLLIAAACVLAAIRLRGWRLFGSLAVLAAALPAVCLISLQSGFILPLGSLLAVYLVSAGIAATSEYALVNRALRTSEQQRRDYASRVQAIAHEIKTPLTAIQGSSELITESSISEEEKGQIAGLIFKESKRLTGIIRAFLEVEQLAAGDVTLRKQPVALAALCEEVLERARLYAARKAVRIEAHLLEASVDADMELLSFAVYNLLTNAVKYSPKGSTVLLEIAVEERAVSISVRDHGYGVAPAEREKIFARFHRSARDRRGPEEGSGIGLALARDIVELHGGRILLDSELGRGSRFTITIPQHHP
ncbi:MAG: CHASE2 domain-containing protein, partial [Acidobacteriales bacterium]